MATSIEHNQPSLVAQSDQIALDEAGQTNDPFLSKSGAANHHRYSHFDTQLFSLGPAASPEQAKRALEAHLAETERRIQEASKLGITLVHQQRELSERLKEVEKQQNDGDITPELRQRLEEIEREYNEVGRESARAFLPKSRVTSSEIAAGDVKVRNEAFMMLFIANLWFHIAVSKPLQIRESSYQLSIQTECAQSETTKPAFEPSS
jgi:hypothetical protein